LRPRSGPPWRSRVRKDGLAREQFELRGRGGRGEAPQTELATNADGVVEEKRVGEQPGEGTETGPRRRGSDGGATDNGNGTEENAARLGHHPLEETERRDFRNKRPGEVEVGGRGIGPARMDTQEATMIGRERYSTVLKPPRMREA